MLSQGREGSAATVNRRCVSWGEVLSSDFCEVQLELGVDPGEHNNGGDTTERFGVKDRSFLIKRGGGGAYLGLMVRVRFSGGRGGAGACTWKLGFQGGFSMLF